MSIAKFKGYTSARGANIQRQNAPQFRTQYSGYQRPADEGATYPVYNPGSHQTAVREPNPQPPKPTRELGPVEKCLFVSTQRLGAAGVDKIRIQIPQWGINQTHVITNAQFNIPPADPLVMTQFAVFGRVKKGTLIFASAVYTTPGNILKGFVVVTCKSGGGYNFEALVGATNYGNHFWLEGMFNSSAATLDSGNPPHGTWHYQNWAKPFEDGRPAIEIDPVTSIISHCYYINNQPGGPADMSQFSGNIKIKWVANISQKQYYQIFPLAYPNSANLLQDAKNYFNEFPRIKFTKEFTINFDNTDYVNGASWKTLLGDIWLA